MNTRARCALVVIALVAAGMACNLPFRDDTGSPVFTAPTQTEGAVVAVQPTGAAPSEAPTAQVAVEVTTASPVPSSTPVAPSQTSTSTTVSTATQTKTASSSVTPSITQSRNSPTPPSTVTPQKTATKTPTQPAVTQQAQARGVVAQAAFLIPAPALDGIWDEWQDRTTEYPARFVVYGASNWSGPDDLEGSYRVGWDSKYLYLAVKVKDDIYVQNASGANLYEGDSLEVLLDTNLFGDFFTEALSGDDYQLGISPGRPDVNGAKEAYLWFPRASAGTRSNVKIASVRQDGVTRYEAAIPWSVFGVNPASGLRLGFALSISDNDNTGANAQQSMVSNVPGRVLVDPTTWGELRLK